MSEDFSKLDGYLREAASRPSGPPPPDFRPAVFAEIARRRKVSPWQRFRLWLDFTEPFYAPRPAIAALALASALFFGIFIPVQLRATEQDSQRVVRALKLDSFSMPKPLFIAQP